jgi:TPR repeat protein
LFVALLTVVAPADAAPARDAETAWLHGDYATAVRLWQSLAGQGDADAQYNLGVMHENGQGVPANRAEAALWYRKAADQGHVAAQTSLGRHYDAAEDYSEAVRWYRKAADQGYPRAQFALGAMYETGKGVPQSSAEAVRWHRKAADQGYPTSQLQLGFLYAEGRLVPRDYVQAHMWFSLAAARLAASDYNNRPFVIAERDRVARRMTGAQIAEAQRLAHEWKPTTVR